MDRSAAGNFVLADAVEPFGDGKPGCTPVPRPAEDALPESLGRSRVSVELEAAWGEPHLTGSLPSATNLSSRRNATSLSEALAVPSLKAENPSPSENSLLVLGIRTNSGGHDLAATPERAIPARGR